MSASRLGLPSYSTIDHGQTIRPSATSLLTIDSDDRFKDYAASIAESTSTSYNISPYNFKIEKSESLIAVPPTRLAVTEAMFQWSIPNINKKTNKILVSYSIGGVITSNVLISLNTGFHTPAQLAAALQAKIRHDIVALSGFTMTYGIDTVDSGSGVLPTNMPVFEYTTGSLVDQIAFSPLPATAGIPGTQKQLFNLLGFNSLNTELGIGGQSGITYCQAISYIDIVCTQLTALQTIRDTTSQSVRRDALCRLYITNPSDVSNVPCSNSAFCPPGCAPFTLYRDFATPKQVFWVPNQPVGGSLEFIVYSDDGTPLSESDSTYAGSNYTNWAITMLLSEN